jgi:hypothetical protein
VRGTEVFRGLYYDCDQDQHELSEVKTLVRILFPPLIRRIGKSNFRASRFLHFFSETFSPLIEAIIVFMPFKVSEIRFIFYSFNATLMSSKTVRLIEIDVFSMPSKTEPINTEQ